MTLSLLIFDVDARTAEFAIAGPPSPLLYRAGHCRPLTDQPGWTLGFPFHDGIFKSEIMTVMPGDAFVCYTDGLSDASRRSNGSREGLGADGFANVLCDLHRAHGTCTPHALFAALEHESAGWSLEDDATALVVEAHY